MRRTDREVTAEADIEDILRRCDCIHLGLTDGDIPYVVPMNFGFTREQGQPVFYMHAAREGKKIDLLQKNPCCAFCLDTGHRVIEGSVGCTWSFAYESVMGTGRVSLVEDRAGKCRGLACILRQYAGEREPQIPEHALDSVAVLRLTVEEISGKRRL